MHPTRMILSRRRLLATAGAGIAALAARPALAAAFPSLAPSGSAGFDHGLFDEVLGLSVRPGADRYNAVDYRALQRKGADKLRSYLRTLQAADPAGLSRREAQAYWINLYNAKTLEVVIDHYPVASIRDIDLGGGGLFKSGPWSKKILTVKGIALSLDDIEHEIIRPMFADPMSHYGLNCASYSCPNLAPRAYRGDTIAEMLAGIGRDYVNHRRGVDVSDGEITASKLYQWYADDFGGKSELKTHWISLASADLAARIEAASLGGFAYDWSLNDIR